MKIIQIIGQCKRDEAKNLTAELIKNFGKSEAEYENYVLNYVRSGKFYYWRQYN